MKKDCLKFKKWLEKKGNLLSFVCYEYNMIIININTWWIDSSLQSILQTLCRVCKT